MQLYGSTIIEYSEPVYMYVVDAEKSQFFRDWGSYMHETCENNFGYVCYAETLLMECKKTSTKGVQ